MDDVINRIITTYGMLRNVSQDELDILRHDVTTFLAQQEGMEERRMAVEGLRYLRRK
jgi:hypothetical protein